MKRLLLLLLVLLSLGAAAEQCATAPQKGATEVTVTRPSASDWATVINPDAAQ